jgi:hypothetical protein
MLPPSLANWHFTEAGHLFTPGDPPSEMISPSAVVSVLHVEGFPGSDPGARVDPPIFGVLTCVDPARCLDWSRYPSPTDPRPVWFVGYPDTRDSMGVMTTWALLDARSGEVLASAGP